MSIQQDNTPTDQGLLFIGDDHRLALAGQAANHYARRDVFTDYRSRKSENTVRSQAASLQRFTIYLAVIGVQAGDLEHDPDAWQGMTYGLVIGFRRWMMDQGDAIGTINLRLASVRVYARLAAEAGALSAEDSILIAGVKGYGQTEAARLDARRSKTRRGLKKAQHTSITPDQAQQLKIQPDTPQGRRDRLLMCLLIDHGLRVGEVSILTGSNFDRNSGQMRFYRPKVRKTQTHQLSTATAAALAAWLDGDALADPNVPILRASGKDGELRASGMSTRALTKRVNLLGERIGIEGLSAHDCRHYWATHWAEKGIDLFRLQEAGGWSSLAMPRRYIEESEIANEGMIE